MMMDQEGNQRSRTAVLVAAAVMVLGVGAIAVFLRGRTDAGEARPAGPVELAVLQVGGLPVT